MFKNKLKRCMASLLIIILTVGMYCPYSVLATQNNETGEDTDNTSNIIPGFSKVVKNSISNFYPSGQSSTAAHLFELEYNNGATEILCWANSALARSNTLSNFKAPNNSDSTFQEECFGKISDDVFSGLDSVNIGNGQGASTDASFDNLSLRMSLFLYARLNPNTIKNENDINNITLKDYGDALKVTLDVPHNESLDEALTRIGILEDSEDNIAVNGKINSRSYAYSTRYLGVFSLASATSTGSSLSWSPTVENEVFIANDYAAHICLSEYIDFYDNEMEAIYDIVDWETNETCISKLTLAKLFAEAFDDYIPVVNSIYELKNPKTDNMSIKDMVEKAGAEDNTISSIEMSSSGSYKAHTDTTTPIGGFYTVNGDIGIVSYDRDSVLNDIEVNTTMDTLLSDEHSSQNNEDALTQENNYTLDNKFIVSQAKYASNVLEACESNNDIKVVELLSDAHYDDIMLLLKDNINSTLYLTLDDYAKGVKGPLGVCKFIKENSTILDVLKDIESNSNLYEADLEYLKDTFTNTEKVLNKASKSKDYGISDEGNSTSYASVTVNKNIVDGMGYSSTFVPMRTNLYSIDVIKSFSGDEDFYDFYTKYGFMRKALYIDKSSTSAVDYYTAGGKFTGSTKVCTLRDLMESGDSDVTLYVDSNFYNADEAIEQGTTLREKTLDKHNKIYESLAEFQPLWGSSTIFNNCDVTLSLVHTSDVLDAVSEAFDKSSTSDEVKINADKFYTSMSDIMAKRHDFNLDKLKDTTAMREYINNLAYANNQTHATGYSEQVLKTDGYTSYSDATRNVLNDIDSSDFVNIESSEELKTTDDNIDSVVMSSAQIVDYMSMETKYEQTKTNEKENKETITKYSKISSYTPMVSLAYVSCLYRDSNLYTLANTVETNNPVFMASDDLCGIKEANQWYRNSLLNYALLKNLKGNAQVDYTYVVDLDCPVYMDVFGNILTESGTVVIPAACNATLHMGSYKDNNFAVGLYSCYGKEYKVPIDTQGAYSVLYPYFTPDLNADYFTVNAITININGDSVRLDKINQYSENVKNGVIELYKAYTSGNGVLTRLNWMAMVKIANEVMRGAPLEKIDKSKENLYTASTRNKSATVAAVKLESLLESLKGQNSNTLLCIPDFTRMDNMEVWVALLIKLMMVATAAVVIISIYRDGVSGKLGLRTFFNSMMAIALSVSCIVVVPSVFQLTYYAANKFALHNESMRILMVNEEKRQCGVEIGMTGTDVVASNGDFSIQLDWIDVPWYEELENILYKSTLDNLQETKLKAYRESTIYNNTDVDLFNDGVYVNTDNLFDSVSIDYTFNDTTSGTKGLYLYANDSQQTASFYSPYYVFLRILTANVNEYNQWRGAYGDVYSSYDEASMAASNDESVILDVNTYTTKYVSGNRLKTVGLCYDYFTSDTFMEEDVDIMRLYQIYGATEADRSEASAGGGSVNFNVVLSNKESETFDRALLFSDEDLESFRTSMWYNNLTVQEMEQRVQVMDSYAKDFIATNSDLLNKVTDETFIKVMSLNMAIKYNQLFGVPCANALEIYNLDSTDLIRLCIAKPDEAVMSSPMSYSRFVFNSGGEASVYAGAILSVIMWLGAFIKPLCTVVVFLSVFLSIFVFRVCLRKPSANLWGYLVTVLLLCATNILHALLLKLGVSLPSFGLSSLGCIIFLIVGQVVYLLVLAYVTGVSLKDWSNLGASEYEKEARIMKSKFKHEDTASLLNGRIKYHDDNWDYYNDLVNQHRSRNAT